MGGSHRLRKKVSRVSGAGGLAWVLLVGMEMAWWAVTSRLIVQNHPGDRLGAQNPSLHSRSHLHPDLLPLRFPVGQERHTQIHIRCQEEFIIESFAIIRSLVSCLKKQACVSVCYLWRPGRCVVH